MMPTTGLQASQVVKLFFAHAICTFVVLCIGTGAPAVNVEEQDLQPVHQPWHGAGTTLGEPARLPTATLLPAALHRPPAVPCPRGPWQLSGRVSVAHCNATNDGPAAAAGGTVIQLPPGLWIGLHPWDASRAFLC